MHKTNCMQSVEHISTWEVFSSICPLKKAAQARLSLHLSKYHIVGNHMSQLICCGNSLEASH